MSNSRSGIFFVAALVMLASCKTHKKVAAVKPPVTVSDSTLKVVQEGLFANQPAYKWLRVKGDVTYEDPDKHYNAATNMKLHKDSLVWASANVMIEVARVLINNDSATLMNRTNHTYMSYSKSSLQNLMPIEGINLRAIQNLLLGYPPFEVGDASKITANGTSYHVEQMRANYKESMNIDPSTMRMTQYKFEKNNTQGVTIDYSDYRTISGQALPGKIVFSILTPEKITLTLDVSDYTPVDTDEAPFFIPPAYTKGH